MSLFAQKSVAWKRAYQYLVGSIRDSYAWPGFLRVWTGDKPLEILAKHTNRELNDLVSSIRGTGIVILTVVSMTAFAKADTLPSNLQIFGTITSSVAGAPTPAAGNIVLAINKTSGAIEGVGSIISNLGTYMIDMSKDPSFNGTVLMIQIIGDGKTYKLMEGATVAELIYTGDFPFSATISKNLTVGSVIGVTSKSANNSNTESNCRNSTASLDNSAKDRSSLANAGYIRSQLGKRNPNLLADVNKDGRVSLADVITAVRATAVTIRERKICPPSIKRPTPFP